MTPNIGVTCNVEVVKYGLWTEPAAMVPLTYVRAIARAGGRPLLIAPTPADLAEPSELLDLLDGLLVTGGADVGPDSYGERPHPETGAATPERAEQVADAMWGIVHARPDGDPVKQRVTEHHEELARLGHRGL